MRSSNVDFGDAVVVTDDPAALSRPAVAYAEVLATPVTPQPCSNRSSRIDPDEPTAYMLTSGSTSMPKAVVQTQRMIASNIAQGRQVLGQTAGWNDVMLDWLPWNHVSGAFTKMGTMTSGGTLYIDGGRPMPGLFEESLQNLKEVTPKFYVNVPFGYAMLADALEQDPELRQRFFGSVRLALYGGAGLPQSLYDRFQRLAIETIGERIFFTTGYGATETSSGCMAIYFPTEEVGIGLPMPGITLKLVPNGPRYEVRLRGPMITPGYLANPEANRGIFDDEGFYRTGDTAQLHDPDDIQKGLKIRRAAGGGLQARHGHVGRCRTPARRARSKHSRRCLPTCWSAAKTVSTSRCSRWPKTRRGRRRPPRNCRPGWPRFNAARGSSERVERLVLLLTEPPSADQHEVSDKGTINQRVALTRRADDVERLYAPTPGPDVILPARPTS